LNTTGTTGSDANEVELGCEDNELAHGDERQDGYQDEDDSMELSDGDDASGAGDKEDGDTIEDVMNLPGKTATPVPVQDYSRFYAQGTPTPDGVKQVRLRRASIERDLEAQCRQQERLQTATITEDGLYDADVPVDVVPNDGLAVEHVGDLRASQETIEPCRAEEERITTSNLNVSYHTCGHQNPLLTLR
jgi:hypothetical protein